MAAMLLADQGAECIKVESLQCPDPSRKLGQQPSKNVDSMGAMFATVRWRQCSWCSYCDAVPLPCTALLLFCFPLATSCALCEIDISQN
eukprot:SAG31_NODE_43555_length_266_cov_1.221557_1_plen_88_part_11